MRQLNFIIKFCMLLPLAFFASCGTNQASTEVENQMQLASVKGVAATGFALSFTKWILTDSFGELIRDGYTDSAGRFNANLKKNNNDTTLADTTYVDSIAFPLILKVILGEDTLYSLVTTKDNVTDKSGELFALVNPVTSTVTKQLLLASDFSALEAARTEFMEQLFNKINYKALWSSPDYAAAIEGNPDVQPSYHDVLIHVVGEVAHHLGVSTTHLLDSLFTQKKSLHFENELAFTMARFGIAGNNYDTVFTELGYDNAKKQYLLKNAQSLQAELPVKNNTFSGKNSESIREMVLRSMGYSLPALHDHYFGTQRQNAESSRNWTVNLFLRAVTQELTPYQESLDASTYEMLALENYINGICTDAEAVLATIQPADWNVNQGKINRTVLYVVHKNVSENNDMYSVLSGTAIKYKAMTQEQIDAYVLEYRTANPGDNIL